MLVSEERQYVRDNIAQFEDDMTKKANQVSGSR